MDTAGAVDVTIFDGLPEALLVVRRDEIAWANRAAEEMLGAGLVGRSLDAILAEGERARLTHLLGQRRAGWELPATCRVRFARPAGGGEVVTDLRFGEHGGDLVLSARDVTDVTRAEELMGRLSRLSAHGAALPSADALLDAATPVFLALGWTVAFTELVADGSITRRIVAPPGDPVGAYGRTLVDVVTPLDRTPILAEIVRTGRPVFLDNLPTLVPGPAQRATALGDSMARAHVIRSAWAPIVSDGKATHTLAVTGRDLTEHDFVAVQLFAAQIGAALHSQRLRAALVHHERLAAVGEMAAVMAHEVRNPLAVIFNALSGLHKRVEGDGARQLLDILREEAERLRRLVNELLDFARPSAVVVEAVDLDAVVRQAVHAAKLDPSVAEVAVEVDVVIAPDARAIETDPALLRRALVNLLVNALQYVREGGRVAVEASRDGAILALRVENDGPPMPAAVAARVFEPFFTTRASGTGLGLAVVRRIIEDLGGSVTLEPSSPGATFSIRIPAGAAARG